MIESITLQNMKTLSKIKMDKVTTQDYILDYVDFGTLEGTHHTYKYVNEIGTYVSSTTLETRNVTIEGWIIATSEIEMTKRKAVLNRFINPLQVLSVFYDNYVIQMKPNHTINYTNTDDKENNEVICKFKIEGYASDPVFKTIADIYKNIASTQSNFHFPLTIPEGSTNTVVFGIKKPNLIVNVVNDGSIDTGMTIVFKANSAVVNPSLTNIMTQETIKISKTLAEDETVTINTNVGERKVIGKLNGIESNYFKYKDIDSDWVQLIVGDNLLSYSADGNVNGLDVYITYSNKYLEVQECY
jgi:hypothetical protein